MTIRPIQEDIVGLLLAGGQARRMGGGDKCLRLLNGETLLHHICRRIAPQVSTLVLNANGEPGRFAAYDLPVVGDVVEGYAGPLAGVLTGLQWMRRHRPQANWLLTCPSDAPFVPMDLAERLYAACQTEKAELGVAASGGRRHPVVGLWPVRLAEALHRAVHDEEIRKIDRWTARYTVAEAAWQTDPWDPFFNANRPEDLETAAALMRKMPDANLN